MKNILSKFFTNQHKIDNGQLGGIISVFSASLVILSPISFVGILALNYDRYLKDVVSLNIFIVISIISFVIYEWIYFAFIYPSLFRFSNRQACTHDNPIYDEIKEIKKLLIELKESQSPPLKICEVKL